MFRIDAALSHVCSDCLPVPLAAPSEGVRPPHLLMKGACVLMAGLLLLFSMYYMR